MQIDRDRVDNAVLALFYLTLHDGGRAWKGADWDVLSSLHEMRLIRDPPAKRNPCR
jgi:hypothetical protein